MGIKTGTCFTTSVSSVNMPQTSKHVYFADTCYGPL